MRGWPAPGQIGLAVAVGLVVALFIGVVSGGGGSKVAETPTASVSSSARPSTTSFSTTTSTTVARSTTAPATSAPTSAAPPATAPPTAHTAAPVPALVPLTIAAPSHQGTYSRSTDFGGWSDVNGCQDTRAALLIRSSQVTVTFTTSSNCTVKTGRWVDPWSGAVATVAHDLQIDHTVPLANAWRSGAWSWTHAQRVVYANDLADADHLVPILAAENESKGDDGPEGWRPPSRGAWCRYALDWDRIKAKWHLSATPAEWAALGEMHATC